MLHTACPLALCCDNCIRKNNPTLRFRTIYDIIGFLDTSFGRESISRPTDNSDSDSGSATAPKAWGSLRTGNRYAARRRALEDWRYNCWTRDYRFCSWGPAGVLSDLMLSKLASSIKIETVDNLLEAASDWGYATKYGHEVLPLLKDADRAQKLESQEQRAETMRAKKRRWLDDLERDERQEDAGGPTPFGPSPAPLPLTRHTRMITPIIVKQVLQPSRPRPRPTPISRPYTRTDIFDSLMINSRSM